MDKREKGLVHDKIFGYLEKVKFAILNDDEQYYWANLKVLKEAIEEELKEVEKDW